MIETSDNYVGNLGWLQARHILQGENELQRINNEQLSQSSNGAQSRQIRGGYIHKKDVGGVQELLQLPGVQKTKRKK